ncbi:hypothetical protein [Phaeodactylibacter luteus]|uniref:Periplasmic heavy metal sensor n=1 Tax=Phaeodactylibacter luteus TaxID=1564516 RepID=A0A5C6RQF0_9BACT|nr:hypothetical protein [Phaeodactylibacter luteus]TXB64463.1 hypothetical protein FRY97_07125 [Phaeodactylibacter luteus]
MRMRKLHLLMFALLLLLAGFAAGWVAHRGIVRQKMQRVAELRKARGFADHFFEHIGATPEQFEQLSGTVGRYGQEMDGLYSAFNQERRSLMDSLTAEVSHLLTEEQQSRLERFSRRFQKRRRHKAQE